MRQDGVPALEKLSEQVAMFKNMLKHSAKHRSLLDTVPYRFKYFAYYPGVWYHLYEYDLLWVIRSLRARR